MKKQWLFLTACLVVIACERSLESRLEGKSFTETVKTAGDIKDSHLLMQSTFRTVREVKALEEEALKQEAEDLAKLLEEDQVQGVSRASKKEIADIGSEAVSDAILAVPVKKTLNNNLTAKVKLPPVAEVKPVAKAKAEKKETPKETLKETPVVVAEKTGKATKPKQIQAKTQVQIQTQAQTQTQTQTASSSRTQKAKVEMKKNEVTKSEKVASTQNKTAKKTERTQENRTAETVKREPKPKVATLSEEEARLGYQRPLSKDEIQYYKSQCRYAFMSEQDVIDNRCEAKKVTRH